MHLTRWGLPSMPDMVSSHLRVLIRSSKCGWQCQEHPLSITVQHIMFFSASFVIPGWIAAVRRLILNPPGPPSNARPSSCERRVLLSLGLNA